MNKWTREPLFHFLLLGAGLFVLHAWLVGPTAGNGEHVVITQGRIDQLATNFSLMHQRPPATDELDGLIQEAIREEILYREAKSLGLDQDDTIVRRRLRQKLEFVSEDVAVIPAPTEQQLQRYLREHPEMFRLEDRYSFTHVYFDPQRRGRHLEKDMAATLAILRQQDGTGATGPLGDRLMLGHTFQSRPADELARLFGARFEQALRSVPPGRWQGPVPSGFGVHLVRVDRRDQAPAATLENARHDVVRAWMQEQRRQANARYYADLRRRYQVTIERAPDTAAPAPAAIAGTR